MYSVLNKSANSCRASLIAFLGPRQIRYCTQWDLCISSLGRDSGSFCIEYSWKDRLLRCYHTPLMLFTKTSFFILLCVYERQGNTNIAERIAILTGLAINPHIQWQINLLKLRNFLKILRFKFHCLCTILVLLSFCVFGLVIYQILIWKNNFSDPSCLVFQEKTTNS